MRLDEGQLVERHAGMPERTCPALLAALEEQDVALRHRQEILHVLAGAEGDGSAHAKRGAGIGQHQGCRPVGNQRAVGPLQRPCDEGVPVALVPAELEAEILAQLRIGIVDAVLVVLGSDHGQRVGLIAMALEIGLRDLAEDAGKAGRRVAVLREVRGAEQVPADLGARRGGHLLGADHEHEAGAPGIDRPDALAHRRRAGGAGVLHARRRLEAEAVVGLQDQARRKVLGREAAVEMAEQDFVDILRTDPGMLQRLDRHLADQAFQRLAFELAEPGMSPAHDACGHVRLLEFFRSGARHGPAQDERGGPRRKDRLRQRRQRFFR